MREIKFKYGYSDGINTFEKAFTLEEIEQGLQFEEISDSPLLKNYKIVYKRQYTGLKDKNGVEIYEGDLMESPKVFFIGVVEFNWGVFILSQGQDLLGRDKFDVLNTVLDFEVIGNIYDNPDLLKG